MRYTKWTDRVADKLKMSKETWIHIGMAVGFAVLISTILLLMQAPSKGQYNADMIRLEDGIVAMSAHIADTDKDVADNTADITAFTTQVGNFSVEQFNGVANKVALHTSDINSLDGKWETMADNITAIKENLATVGSPPEGYLTGTYGNYTLHAKASDAGNFTANIHLVYSPPKVVGNGTTYDQAMQAFYAGIDYVAANTTEYACTVIYTGATWGVSRVWFNIGTFELVGNTEKAIAVPFGGLNSTYTPNYAYVEVYPVVKEG